MTYVPVWVLQASSAATQYLGSYQHDEAIQCYSQAIRSSHLQSFRNGWIRSQWGALRSWPSIWCGVPTSPATALNFGTGATDGSHGHGGKKHGGNWTPIDTHTHICIYMYIYVCLHIYVHIICICWSCPFLCVWMYVFLFNYPEMGSRIVRHAHININHITHVARLNHVSLGFPHGRWNNIGYLKPLAS